MKINEKSNEEDTSNNEDTSKESDDSKEEDSSVEDSSSDGSKDDDSKDDDSGDEEDITKQYFTNPDSLDPKLRGAFKKMQGVFTKKVQELSLGIKEAKAFRLLITDPEFRTWMEERHARVNGKSSNKKASRDEDDSEDDDIDDDAPMTRGALRKELERLFTGMQQEGTKAEQAKAQAKAMKEEADTFKADNPDWEIFKEPMMELIEKHPTLSYQDAYDLAVREDRKKTSNKETLEKKKRANINKPNKVTGKNTEKKGKMSIKDAFDLAKKSLGMND